MESTAVFIYNTSRHTCTEFATALCMWYRIYTFNAYRPLVKSWDRDHHRGHYYVSLLNLGSH